MAYLAQVVEEHLNIRIVTYSMSARGRVTLNGQVLRGRA